jgi:hypothetical protein
MEERRVDMSTGAGEAGERDTQDASDDEESMQSFLSVG